MTDASKIVENLLLYCDAMDNATATLRQNLKKLGKSETPQATEPQKNLVFETVFSNLNWSNENGAKLGAYQTALEQDNDPEKWKNAYNTLNANNATISNRFQKEAYQNSYWLFDKTEYKIFRQKLKDASR